MTCLLVAAACWVPPIPLQPLPPPPPLVRTEWQEHGWRLPAPEVAVPAPSPRAVPTAPSPSSPPPPAPSGVEQWRTLVTQWFGDRTDAALAVIACESGGNPSAVNGRSGASGLFQHLPRYWADRAAAAGFAGADILDAEANIAVAAWLSGGGTDWSHWTCRP